MKHEERLPREIFLKPYEECVGIYKGLRTSESEIMIVLSLANGETLEILFQKASVNGANVLRELHGGMIGRKIGIMRIDDRENSIRIKIIVSEADVSQYRARGENR